jgi:hypothetical protein
VSITSLDSVRSFKVKLAAFGITLATHKQRATEFAPNSHLYREIIHTRFSQTEILHFQEQRAGKRWPASPEVFLAWLDLRQSAMEATDIGVRPKATQPPTTTVETLNTAFTTLSSSYDEMSFPEMVHDSAADDEAYIVIHEDTPSIIVQQMLNIRSFQKRNLTQSTKCSFQNLALTASSA